MASKKQTITEGALTLTLAIAVVKVVGLIYKFPLISRLAGGGWGYYQTAYNIYSAIYAVAVTGFPSAVARLVAGYAAKGCYKDVLELKKQAVYLFSIIGLIGSGGLMLLARPLSEDLMQNPGAYFSVLAVAPSIFFSCLMSAYRGYYQGLSNMVPTAISQVVEVIFKAGFGYAAVILINHYLSREYDAYGTVMGIPQTEATMVSSILSYCAAGAIFAVTVSTLAGYLCMLVTYKRKGSEITNDMLENSPEGERVEVLRRQILRFGFPLALSAIALRVTSLIDNATVLRRLTGVIDEHLDVLYASHHGLFDLIDVEVTDLPNYLYEVYGYGMPLFDLVPTITATFGTSALPHITGAYSSGDMNGAKRAVEQTLSTTMLIAAPAGFGMAFMALPLLNLLYPALPVGSQLAAPMLTILGVAAVFSCLTSSVNTMLQAIGKIDVPVKLMMVGCVIKVVTNYIFISIPQLNIKAAPLGNLFCYITTGIVGLLLLLKYSGLRVDYK
ncbi:MAG: polysaccharide biosynthesis protein [Oscillospiraceae bacterium]|nr:polysaccharide biosynthesis protein [Oscillospiraceae bacterium]